jgi:RNA polymerase sigma-70 factor (ECF subfamily)
MADEAELVRRAAAGDLGAFDELVVLKRDRVYRTAWQVVRNGEDAQDVAQLVFVKLWRLLRRYRSERKFDTWLHRITINQAIDFRRRQARPVRVVPLEGPGEGPEQVVAPEFAPPTPADTLDRAELRRIYEAVAGELTERQRTIFTMREVEGLSAADIAKTLGVTSSTVRNTLFQARAILQETLARKFPEYARMFRPEAK